MPLTAEDQVKLSKMASLDSKEQQRQKEIEDRIAILEDDWKDQIATDMAPRVSKETAAITYNFITMQENPFKTVTEDLSTLYKTGVSREFDGPGAEKYEEIYQNIEMDTLMEQAQFFMNGLNDAALYPVWRDGAVDVDLLTPNVITVITKAGDPTAAEKVLIKRRKNEIDDYTPENTYWVVWTETEHYWVSSLTLWEPQAIEGNPEMINPYGKIMLVFLHRYRQIDQFWNRTKGNDLIDMNFKNADDRTMDWFTRYFNSFKSLGVTGQYDSLPQGMNLTPDVVIGIEGNGVSMQVLDWQADLEGLNQDRAQSVEAVLKPKGITISEQTTGEAESGIALFIRNRKLKQFREQQVKIMMQAEQELFELIKLVDSYWTTGKAVDDGTTLTITYEAEEIYIDPQVKLEIQEKEMSLGLASKVDIFMARNPDFKGDRQEALKKLQEIADENNELAQRRDSVFMDALNEGAGEESEGEEEEEEEE
jgi:hypothetical protein